MYTEQQTKDLIMIASLMEEMDMRNKDSNPDFLYLFWDHYDDSSTLYTLVLEVYNQRLEDESLYDCVNRYRLEKEENKRKEDEE